MFCPSCGSEASASDRFCPSCGAQVEEDSQGGPPPTESPTAPAAPSGRPRWLVPLLAVGALLIVGGGVAAGFVLSGDSDDKQDRPRETIGFERVDVRGPDPFFPPADVRGARTIKVAEAGAGADAGSDRVCNREQLIRSTKAQDDRVAAWARVLGLKPTASAVADYIRGLTPKTLIRDSRFTVHGFATGQARSHQAILQAGNAILVNDDGEPVVRCHSGSPLTKPVEFPRPAEVECIGCPRGYNFVVATCPVTHNCTKAYPDPPPVRASGGLQKSTVFAEPCEVATPSGDMVAIKRVRGALSCPEAQSLLREYYAAAPTGQRKKVSNGWTCEGLPSSTTGSAGSCEQSGGDEGLLTVVKADDIQDCKDSAHGTNVIISSVRNMTCEEAVIEQRAYVGPIDTTFTTPGGFACSQLSGQALGGQWRCDAGERAYRFEFAD